MGSSGRCRMSVEWLLDLANVRRETQSFFGVPTT